MATLPAHLIDKAFQIIDQKRINIGYGYYSRVYERDSEDYVTKCCNYDKAYAKFLDNCEEAPHPCWPVVKSRVMADGSNGAYQVVVLERLRELDDMERKGFIAKTGYFTNRTVPEEVEDLFDSEFEEALEILQDHWHMDNDLGCANVMVRDEGTSRTLVFTDPTA